VQLKLSVLDRFTLLNVLPKEGNYFTLKIVRDLQNELGFSEQELKDINFKEEGAGATWIEADKDIQIGEKATDIIVDAFKKLDKNNKLNIEMLGTYGKFINCE